MSENAESVTAAEAEVRLLALLLTIFSIVKILACAFGYVSAIISAGGVDEQGGHTFYWLPQLLFYTLLLTASRRVSRFDRYGRNAIISLSMLSLFAMIAYTAADFTVGVARNDPAMAIAIKLRLMVAGGDIWDIVFPLLAITRLRGPRVDDLFR